MNGGAIPLPLLPGGTTSVANAAATQPNVMVGSGDPGAQAIVWQNGTAMARAADHLDRLSSRSVATSFGVATSCKVPAVMTASRYFLAA
jgi:hypothetical protein